MTHTWHLLSFIPASITQAHLINQIATWLFVPQFVQADNKETSQLCITGSLWGESTSHLVDSPHKGPVMQKAFPCMTSSVSLICATIKRAPSMLTTKTCTCHGLLTGQWQFLLTVVMAALSLSGDGTDHRRLACHDGGISKIVMAECGDGLGP